MNRAAIRNLLCAVAAVAANTVGPVPTVDAATKVNPVTNADHVFRTYATVPPGFSCWWAYAQPVTGDTVLHALRWNGSAYVEYAHNDDYDVASYGLGSLICVPPGDYMFVVRAHDDATGGTFHFSVTGTSISQTHQPFGGKTVVVTPYDEPVVYQTAPAPASSVDTYIYGIDTSGAIVAWDDQGAGIGNYSRLSSTPSMAKIIVGSWTPSTAGNAVLYLNDTQNDGDGDTLGRHLEQALGTCDNAADPGCGNVHNRRDTERDGLEDNVEVFGVSVPANVQNGQNAPATSFLFPKWGARPRHKDLFITLDYVDEIGANPFTHAYALAVRGLFAGALAADIGNKDGLDGIDVHLDIGLAAQPGFETLYGNWGNGGQHGPAATRNAWQLQFPGHDNRRDPWFFPVAEYGTAGTGSSGFNDSTWHELQHTLLIGHESVRGGLNSSVVSPSLASYTQWRNPDGKVLGNQFLDAGLASSSLCESTNEIGPALADPTYRSYLRNNHGIWSDATTVDWNRDGVITACATGGRVKANLASAPRDNTAPVQGEQTLARPNGTAGGGFGVGAGDIVGTIAGAPHLVRLGNAPHAFLYVFYAKTDPSYGTRLYYRAGRLGTDKANGGCATSAGMEFVGNSSGPGTTTPCITWSNATQVGLIHGVKRFAVTALADRIEIAASNANDSYIDFYQLTGQNVATGLMAATPTYVGGVGLSSSPQSDLQYEVVRAPLVTGDTVNQRLALFWIDAATRELRWASKPAGATGLPTFHGPLRTNAPVLTNLVAHASSSLTLASWGNGMTGSLARETFLFFHDGSGTGSLHKLDPATERWVNVTATALPGGNCSVLGQKVGFRFLEDVTSAGEIQQAGKGHFYLTHENCGGSALATLGGGTVGGMPTALSAARKPSSFLAFERGNFAVPNQGQHYGTTGIAYYADAFVTSLKQVYVDAGGELRFLPFADGILKMQYRPTNQFKIYEATICRALKSHPWTGLASWSQDVAAGDAFCGNNGMRFGMHPKDFVPSTQTLWGF